jgi:NAD(P) transhydrogenase subunit alpha
VKVAVLKERAPAETRVALTADVAGRLVKAGHEVRVEAGAGVRAAVPDAAYEKAGARVGSAASVVDGAHLVLLVAPPTREVVQLLPRGVVLASFLFPAACPDVVEALRERGVSAFALDQLPRITRAQDMDALSSMSTVAGYRAALLAAERLPRFFPMLMTAAGTIPPARVVVLGVGVAGLMAIATCRRLGAVVDAYDVRADAREQAKSLGARLIEVPLAEAGEGEGGYARKLSDEAERALAEALAQRIRAADVVITTALVPGKAAPRLVSAETVRAMKPGSVVIDLAAEAGGNCPLTRAGETVEDGGVTIVGPVNLPASMPYDASQMYAKNLEVVVKHLSGKDGGLALEFGDEITAGAVVVHAGEVRGEAQRRAPAARGAS